MIKKGQCTRGGLQDVTFLTEKGLYKILFKSRKPIAEKFQNWVCDVVKELCISDKTLEKALTRNALYNGNYFKYIGIKVKCL